MLNCDSRTTALVKLEFKIHIFFVKFYLKKIVLLILYAFKSLVQYHNDKV